jgi:hypothetical protein
VGSTTAVTGLEVEIDVTNGGDNADAHLGAHDRLVEGPERRGEADLATNAGGCREEDRLDPALWCSSARTDACRR